MLGAGILLLVSVFASKTSTRFGIPVLLIFIVIGMISGGEGPGGIRFDSPAATHVLGTVALSYILFSGGLSTEPVSVRPIWREGCVLALFGVLISTAVMAVMIHFCLNWDWATSALLSATVSSTDASAVFGILKTQKLRLKKKIESLIELESGSNDPMAVFLTLSLIHIILLPGDLTWFELLQNFFIQMSLGGLAGWFMGKALVHLINWLDLEFDGLYPVLTIAGVLCIYSVSEFAGGNGFLSVYIAGLAMAGEKFFSKKSLIVFHDGLAWLMQVAMFLTLGLLVSPTAIRPIMGSGLVLSLALLLLARPISTYLCLKPFKYKLNEILFISWGGLRGAVPIILATYLLVSGIPGSHTMFNLVFFIVIMSMLVQGTTLGKMAQWLKVQEPFKLNRVMPFKSRSPHREFVEFEIGPNSPLIGKNILELDFPMSFLVVLIHRGERDFMPRGNTEIELYDRLVCLVDTECIRDFEKLIQDRRSNSSNIG